MGVPSSLGRNFKPRLTQDEKTAETRRRLLDSAILCLVDRGYANTTTSEVAERAGLSRGAQLYHFPRKEELLTSAVEHLFQLVLDDIRERTSRLTSDSDRRETAVDALWEMANGPLMTAWIELVVASRTDFYLRDSVRAVNDRMTQLLAETFRKISSVTATTGDRELTPVMIILIVEAMALEGKTLDPKLAERILNALKLMNW